ncbi:MAG: folylpolyglutamate synthase/dihydrofolate synthase family protein [Ectobacillus sp.]
MIHTYEEAIKWIHSRLKFGMKPGLERMQWMLGRLDNPERRIKCVHFAGTNGKGSTVTYMRSILQQAGYKVGTFTSPYIETFNERISVNGVPIPDEDLVQLVNSVKPVVEQLDETELGAATEFEILTAMAFYYFGKEEICDIVLLETGLGGRYDSTNVIYPVLSVITTIGHDHMHILGETLAEIAAEKAGIIKPGVPVISGAVQPEAKDVIYAAAARQNAKVYQLGTDFSFQPLHSKREGEEFSFDCPFRSFDQLLISMKGMHQVHNAALSLMGIMYLKTYQSFLIEDNHVREGLKEAFWLGRFEELSQSPAVIIDGAHNPEGIDSLVQTIQSHYGDKKVIVLFSALGDKKIDEMIEKLQTVAARMIFTTFSFPRAVSAQLLAAHCHSEQKQMYADWKEAIAETIPLLQHDEVLLITGSLYFISEVRKYITETVGK